MKRAETDYPQGDGMLGCPECKGRGVVPIPKEDLPPYALPGATRYCKCVFKRDLLDNLRRGWSPLVNEGCTSTKKSPLISLTRKNMWIRCDHRELAGHIRAAAVRQSPRWRFKVITDADLMTTWLYSANEVYDADVGLARTQGTNQNTRISDLVEPFELLILRTGYKAARNKATPEVVLEALLHRDNYDLPTWVIDSPTEPLRQSHIAWDEKVQQHLNENFTFLDLSAREIVAPPTMYHTPAYSDVEDQVLEDDDDVLDANGRVKVKKTNWRKR